MNQTEALNEIRSLGMTATVKEREFRINYKGGSEETAYYTDDPQDAVDTAKHMKREADQQETGYQLYAKQRSLYEQLIAIEDDPQRKAGLRMMLTSLNEENK